MAKKTKVTDKVVELQTMSMDDIPFLLEELNSVFKREIDKWKADSNMSDGKVKLSLDMYNKLNSAYLSYRILRRELLLEIKSNPVMSINKIEQQIKDLTSN